MILKADISKILNTVLKQSAKIRQGGDQLLYFCPKCHHRKRKLEVSLAEDTFGIFHCWTCHFKGNIFGLLTDQHASQSAINDYLSLTKSLKHRKRVKVEKNVLRLPNEFKPLSEPCFSPEYKQALFYLKKRGLKREDIIRYNIGYCEEGEYAFHIVVPSYDSNGNLNFFIGRRYYNTPNAIPFKKPKCSMNIIGFESFINYKEPLNICEGVFDAFSIRNNAIPLFGKFMSKKLMEAIIINDVKQVNMILDDDALRESLGNCITLQKMGVNVNMVKLSGKDPSLLGTEKTTTLIQNSKPLEFIDIIKHKFNL